MSETVNHLRRIADELRDAPNQQHPGRYDGEWVARAATELEQFEEVAVAVYANYDPDYYPKLPICVQRLWRLGKGVMNRSGREVERFKGREMPEAL